MRASLLCSGLAACALAILLARAEASTPSCTAHLQAGTVQGSFFKPFPSCEYKGIPYAEPPLGEKRLAAPVPLQKFKSSPLQATSFGPGCPQVCNLQQPNFTCPHVQSEDCLYLNVYTPVPAADGSPYAVLLFIHGGNYVQGAGGVNLYHGGRWASENDVVIVTINYRLGVLGGLYTSAAGGPRGNFGIQDQRLSMKWVRENIANFGGDPKRVTIFGQSAGGHSVASHYSSPKSYEFFDRAIMQSNPYSLPTETAATAPVIGDAFAKNIGCPSTLGSSQITCLRAANATQMLKTQKATHYPSTASKPRLLHKPMPWTPVVRNISGAELPLAPIDAATLGRTAKKPVMLGTVANESIQFVWGFTPKPMPKLEYELFLETLFGPKDAKRLFALYGPPPANETKDVRYFLSVLATDYIFTCPNAQVAAAYASQAPVHVYVFDHYLSYTHFVQNDWYPECDDYICHGAELVPLFHTEYLVPNAPTPTPEESVMARQLQTAWSNFAKSADPNSPVAIPRQDGQTGTFHFPAAVAGKPRAAITNISVPLGTTTAFRGAECDVFDQIGYHRG